MAYINGGTANINALKQPRGTLTSYGYSESDNQVLLSCNNPMIYQLQWGQTLGRIKNIMLESEYTANDVVNVIFDVYIGNEIGVSSNVGGGNMVLAGSLRKSRDLPYIANEGINPQYTTGNALIDFHTFTVDISSIVKNYLTYTLTPILKGSPSSQFAMSGNYNTNNLLDYTSISGTDRFVDVRARFEIYEQDPSISKKLIEAEGYKDLNVVGVINAAIQHTDNAGLNNYVFTNGSETASKKFLSNCKNDNFAYSTVESYKSIRLDDEGEYLSWWQYRLANDGSPTYTYDMTDFYMYIVTTESDGSINTASLRDFQETLGNDTGTFNSTWWATIYNPSSSYIYKVLSQNISPAFINSVTAGTITSDTESYEVKLICSGATLGASKRVSESRFYRIDKETKNPAYDFVRFHWLNRMGGIDSYTAKRNITETVQANKIFFERKSPNPLYAQQYSASNVYGFTTSRDPVGSDLYKPSVNTFSIEATRSNTVYTEPLNDVESKWLEEIITSPNVWIELLTEAGDWNRDRNPESHPSQRDYFAVTINNSEVETVNQELGLVKFNLTYTMANGINTQSN
tara:strand:+ start:1451 stop:3169 length:1719 start_codon:yes stop_codon:yes gene_type:complete